MTDVMNIRSVKLTLSQSAGQRGGRQGRDERMEGQARGVRQGGVHNNAGERGEIRGEEIRGDGLENGHLLG